MTLNDFKNIHRSERCFILGNSPSLKLEALELLSDEIVFICNRGYKAKELGLKSFKYYILSDANLYRDFSKELDENIDCVKFISSSVINKCSIKIDPDKIIPFNRLSNKIVKEFPNDPSNGWDRVLTVVLDAAIIAYFMGFKEIYFLGVDLNYEKNKNNHFYKDSETEKNRYNLIPGQLDKVLDVFKIIKKYLDSQNIVFKNLSKEFKHNDVLESGELEKIL